MGRSARNKGLRLNRTFCRQVLECGCPLPLWIASELRNVLQSARGQAHSKTLARITAAPGGSWPVSRSARNKEASPEPERRVPVGFGHHQPRKPTGSRRSNRFRVRASEWGRRLVAPCHAGRGRPANSQPGRLRHAKQIPPSGGVRVAAGRAACCRHPAGRTDQNCRRDAGSTFRHAFQVRMKCPVSPDHR